MAEGKLPTRAEDFAEWYNQIVIKADLVDYAPVRGCMVVKPYGWALWENITSWLDKEFKATGHVNAAFPTWSPRHAHRLALRSSVRTAWARIIGTIIREKAGTGGSGSS